MRAAIRNILATTLGMGAVGFIGELKCQFEKDNTCADFAAIKSESLDYLYLGFATSIIGQATKLSVYLARRWR